MTEADAGAAPRGARGTFGPVVLLGLASAALAAVASAKPWFGRGSEGASDTTVATLDTGTRYPVASAISLVLLASWGVLLVTRGPVRRTFAFLAVIAAVALVVAVVTGHSTLSGSGRDSYAELMSQGTGETGFTGWFWTAAVCSVVAVVPAVLAARLVASWPEMGSRYDAPGTPAPASEQSTADPDRDLWHALDEGRDPTDPDRLQG